MTIREIEELAKKLADKLVDGLKRPSDSRYPIKYDSAENLVGECEKIYTHQGLYGICVSKEEKNALIYIGKSEGNDRLRQHLTGKNKDGTPLKSSVHNKNKAIKQAINDGFSVHLSLYQNSDFGKSSLSCMEIAAALYAKKEFTSIFPEYEHWNTRIG
jgi:hypothetical protein